MNLAFYRMLTKANQDKPAQESKPCNKCTECKCTKSSKNNTEKTDA